MYNHCKRDVKELVLPINRDNSLNGDGRSNQGLPTHPASSNAEMVLSQIQSSIASLSNRLQRMEDQILSLRTDLRRQSLNTMPQGEKSPASISLQGSTSSQLTSGKWSLSISPGKYFIEDLTGATIFLGSKSDPPSILGCRQVSSDDTLDASILDQLAPKTYPFANLWTPDIRLSEIISALPDDAGIMR